MSSGACPRNCYRSGRPLFLIRRLPSELHRSGKLPSSASCIFSAPRRSWSMSYIGKNVPGGHLDWCPPVSAARSAPVQVAFPHAPHRLLTPHPKVDSRGRGSRRQASPRRWCLGATWGSLMRSAQGSRLDDLGHQRGWRGLTGKATSSWRDLFLGAWSPLRWDGPEPGTGGPAQEPSPNCPVR